MRFAYPSGAQKNGFNRHTLESLPFGMNLPLSGGNQEIEWSCEHCQLVWQNQTCWQSPWEQIFDMKSQKSLQHL